MKMSTLFHRVRKYTYSLVLLGVLVCFDTGTMTEASPARQALIYLEHADGSPNDEIARSFQPIGNRDMPIDINSRIEITFDPAVLGRVTATDGGVDASALNAQLDALIGLADTLEALRQAWVDAAEAFDAYERSRTNDALEFFRERRRKVAIATDGLIGGLEAAAEARLRAENLDSAAIDAYLDTLDLKYTAPPQVQNYNWPALKGVIQQEMDFLQEAVDALPVEEIEIRAYHVTRDGAINAIHLPKYNDVPSCASASFQRIASFLSPEVATAFQKRQELAAELSATTSALDGMLQLVKQEFRLIEPDFRRLLDSLRVNMMPLQSSLDRVAKWHDPIKWQNWSSSIVEVLANDLELEAMVDSVRTIAEEIDEDLQTLKKLQELPRDLSKMRPDVAIQEIVSTLMAGSSSDRTPLSISPQEWIERAQSIRALLRDLDGKSEAVKERLTGSDSPLFDVQVAVDEIERLPAILSNSTEQVRKFIAEVTGFGYSAPLADLYVPEGQRRVAITDDPNTEFNLKTICGKRHSGDKVIVKYVLYSDGRDMNLGWTDTFVMKIFGASTRYFASTGFVRQSNDNQYEPSALISYMFKYRSWPGGKRHLYGWIPGILASSFVFSGIGVSALTLDFSDSESIETGLAATLAIAGDRLLVGYGYNPMVDHNREFWFVSIRVFGSAQNRDQSEPAP